MITYEKIKNNPNIRAYILAGNELLGQMGYTEHGFAHAELVSTTTARILKILGDDEHTIELGRIAGYIHDIGNMVNRDNHALTGACLIVGILENMGMPPADIALIASAVGNHDEKLGVVVNRVGAALIIADKADARRTRVRRSVLPQLKKSIADIHDRVNYAVNDTQVDIDTTAKKITLVMQIDTEVCPVMDYFEIFLNRMLMCRHAAEYLGHVFKLNINGTVLL